MGDEEATGGGRGWEVPPRVAFGARAMGLGGSLLLLAEEHAAWSRATFGEDHERGPVGPLRHLRAEADEAIEACEGLARLAGGDDGECKRQADKVVFEYADLLLLWLDATRRSGLTPADVVRAAHEKLKVLKTRVYPRTPDGVPSMHVRPGRGGATTGRFAAWLDRQPAWLTLPAGVVLFTAGAVGVAFLTSALWRLVNAL